MPNKDDFNHFAYNPTDINIDRSLFNMDHSVKFSCNVGEVIPFDCIECLPGDTWTINTSKVVRLQPLVAPIMDEVILDVYYFFIPNRLVFNKWKEFCGENNASPWAPSVEYYIPILMSPEGGWNVGTIADYLGVPPKTDIEVSALPFRAYALVCDQWFRSEAVMNPVNVDIGVSVGANSLGSNGSDQVTDIQFGGEPFIACKFFDRFTSALPSPQRGDAANVFPDNSYAPVVSLSSTGLTKYYSKGHPQSNDKNAIPEFGPLTFTYKEDVLENPKFKNSSRVRYLGNDAANGIFSDNDTNPTTTNKGYLYPSNLFTRLDATTFDINDLRNAFAVQRYLEKSARYGGRYIEFVKGFFGVDSPDARLQRTEYLGGSRLSLNINQVTQNSATEAGSTPLGNVAGMSVTGDINSDVQYSCTEHGMILGCAVLRYNHSYQQGVNKMFLRKHFTDFYLPTFAFLGEEPVYESELYCRPAGTDPYYEASKTVFGYQERWSEYRYLPNRIAGQMRTVADTSLDVWHLADYYESSPTLTPEWLREDKSMLDRCLAVTSEVADQCICDFYLECKAARPMPLYSVPGLIDHY